MTSVSADVPHLADNTEMIFELQSRLSGPDVCLKAKPGLEISRVEMNQVRPK